MTIIVCKDGVMCSDSQGSRGDFIDNTNTKKIHEVGGCLIGISGSLIGAMKFVDWFADKYETDVAQQHFPYVTITPPEDIVDKDFQCLVMYPDKTVHEFTGCDEVLEIKQDYCAAGSGMFLALAALDAGASAEEATAIAIKRDVFCGGDIQKFNIEDVEQPLTEDEIRNLSKEELINLNLYGSVKSSKEGNAGNVAEKSMVQVGEESSDSITYNIKNLPKYLTVGKSGVLYDEDGTFNNFSELDCCIDYLKNIATALGVTYAHNISKETLATRLDEKVKEIVAELNSK